MYFESYKHGKYIMYNKEIIGMIIFYVIMNGRRAVVCDI